MASTPELAVEAANASLNLHEHPISRLSDDILSYFFESMLDPDPLPDLDGNIWKPAMVVAAVCKHWRLVALSAPSVWRNIIIAPHCPPSHYTHYISLFLARSRAVTLDVVFYDSAPIGRRWESARRCTHIDANAETLPGTNDESGHSTDSDRFWNLVDIAFDRARSLRIYSSHFGFLSLVTSRFRQIAPCLQLFLVNWMGSDEYSDIESAGDPLEVVFFQTAPLLQTLTVSGNINLIWPETSSRYPLLTRIEGYRTHMTTPLLSSLFTQCPALRYLSLYQRSWSSPPSPISVRSATLTHLSLPVSAIDLSLTGDFSFPALQSAEIDLGRTNQDEALPVFFSNALHSVRRLTLHAEHRKTASLAPAFEALSHLEALELVRHSGAIETLLEALAKRPAFDTWLCPKLQELEFGDRYFHDIDERWPIGATPKSAKYSVLNLARIRNDGPAPDCGHLTFILKEEGFGKRFSYTDSKALAIILENILFVDNVWYERRAYAARRAGWL